jgi:hypothetical protein
MLQDSMSQFWTVPPNPVAVLSAASGIICYAACRIFYGAQPLGVYEKKGTRKALLG